VLDDRNGPEKPVDSQENGKAHLIQRESSDIFHDFSPWVSALPLSGIAGVIDFIFALV